MQLTLQPTRFDIETTDPEVHVTVRPRFSREDEETLVELRVAHFPKVSFRPEQAPGDWEVPAGWIWDGSVAEAKRIAQGCIQALAGMLAAKARREGPTQVFRSQALAALGAGAQSPLSSTQEAALRRQG